ncbi:hypothetical protein K1719_009785 [Acacia pycnantha]|nr:hypothetical protein K1719_009785 [Acacia pycnantha]
MDEVPLLDTIMASEQASELVSDNTHVSPPLSAEFVPETQWSKDSPLVEDIPMDDGDINAVPTFQVPSFKDKLLNSNSKSTNDEDDDIHLKQGDVSIGFNDNIPTVDFANHVKETLNRRMGLVVVVKLLRRKIGYRQLCTQLQNIWKPAGHFKLTDMDEDCFLVRFQDDLDYQNAILSGPWMVYGHYLSVQPWTPSFKPQDHVINQVMGWIRLPKLPVRYYHKSVIRSIGIVLGEVIRVDYNIDSGDRGKLARISVCIDLTKPLISKILVDGELIYVEYEGLPTICFSCGKYGQLQEACPAKLATSSGVQSEKPLELEPNAPKSDLQARESSQFGAWMQVQRRRRYPVRGDILNEGKVSKTVVSASRYEVLNVIQEEEVTRAHEPVEENLFSKEDASNRKKKVSESKPPKKPSTGTKNKGKGTALQITNQDSIFLSKPYVASKVPTSLDQTLNCAIQVVDPRSPRRPNVDQAYSSGPAGGTSSKTKPLHGNDPLSMSRGLKLSSGVTIHKLGSKHNPDRARPLNTLMKQITSDLFNGNDSIEDVPLCQLLHLPKILSDHQPIMIMLGFGLQAHSSVPFRFLAPWITHADFPSIVQRIWSSGGDLFTCIEKFNEEMKSWNSNTFGHIGKRKRILLRRINGLQAKIEDQLGAPSDFLIDLETSLREEFEKVCLQEELLWIQKSSSEWLCLGDRNTNYYHMKTLLRRKKRFISKLKQADGSWVSDDDHLSNLARQFFMDLYFIDDPGFTPLSLSGAFPSIPEHMSASG